VEEEEEEINAAAATPKMSNARRVYSKLLASHGNICMLLERDACFEAGESEGTCCLLLPGWREGSAEAAISFESDTLAAGEAGVAFAARFVKEMSCLSDAISSSWRPRFRERTGGEGALSLPLEAKSTGGRDAAVLTITSSSSSLERDEGLQEQRNVVTCEAMG
jgi:hypothetical protein